MRIIACYKNAPDMDSLKTEPGKAVDASSAGVSIGQYDLNAIEAAVQLSSGFEYCEVIVLTAAGAVIDNTKQRKAALSRGAGRMIGVRDEGFDCADEWCVASAIAKAVESIGGADLVICGEGSSDMYSQQVGCLTGAILGWNELNGVSSIEPCEGGVLVRRELESCTENYRVTFPAVLSVTSNINHPRIPSMKDILAAGKKPVEILTATDLGVETSGPVHTVSVTAPERVQRKRQVYQSLPEEAVDAVALEISKLL